MGFRFKGASDKDATMISMVDMILSNSVAGLIDINLNQSQEIIGGGSWTYILQDYSLHTFYGSPSKGQSLEEVKDLLLEQIEEIKSGNFEEWLIDAVISDLKISQIKKYETNSGRANEFVQAFTLNMDWKDYQNKINQLELITKQEIVDFVNDRYRDNYVVVYKRLGEDKSSVKVTKPEITPVSINRTDQSVFLKDYMRQVDKTIKIQPVFLDFSKDISQSKVGDVNLLYKTNHDNDRFRLRYIIDMGNDHNNKFGLAVDYLNFLGTKDMSPAEKQQEFYKLGSDLSVSCNSDRIQITLSGLQENFEASVILLEDILKNATGDEDALIDLKNNILKSRNDAKLNKRVILQRAMMNYARYGDNSSFTNILTEDELKNVTSTDLLDIINNFTTYEHRLSYYGPEDLESVAYSLSDLHIDKFNLKDLPSKKEFTEKDLDDPIVYVLDYDMKQAEILMISKGEQLNKEKYSKIKFHNEYFGGGMSSIVFQDMRESKALAYSVYSTYRIPTKINEHHYLLSYIGTQSDKLEEAMAGMSELLNVMPEADANMKNAKEAIIKKIRTERITKSRVIDEYEKLSRMGINYDIRKDLYENISSFDMATLREFHNNHIANDTRVVMVIGSIKDLDLKVLEEYGEIKILSLEEVFGY